jgi:glycoside hydrolase-like protein
MTTFITMRRLPRSASGKRYRNVAIWLVAAASAIAAIPYVAQLTPRQVGASIAHAPEVVAELPAAAVSDAVAGKHLGFDTSIYPGDDAMRAWKDSDAPYEWVGYYLAAPCHKDASWVGTRETLSRMGWGLAVIYVGQQTWGRTPGKAYTETRYVTRKVKQTVRRNGRRVTRYVRKRVPIKVTVQPRAAAGQACSTQLVGATRGRAEADDAIQKTAAEGFADGTVVFLDVEYMDAVPNAMRDYYSAWVARVLEDGRFRPGIYAHTRNAEVIYGDVNAVYDAAGVSDEPPFWIASGRNFSTDKAPHEVGHDFAAVWQGILDIVETRNGVKMPIDVNVAAVPSPSDQYISTD